MGKLKGTSWQSTKPGRYQDGDGLSLLVKPEGTASWVLRIQADGQRCNFGLGSRKHVSLAEAREKAAEYRRQFTSGVDPVLDRRRKRAEAVTFETYARQLHVRDSDPKHPRWTNAKHGAQWLSSLENHAFKSIGAIPVTQLTNQDVIAALEPIWRDLPETSKRVLSRIVEIAETAAAAGMGDTPLRRGVIVKGLPKRSKATGVRNHPAMPYADVPAFMARLRDGLETSSRNALQFLILTAGRSGEVRAATWDEIDLDAATWTLSPERMKARREHIVALSEPAVALLRRLAAVRTRSPYLFPGLTRRPLSDAALSKALVKDGGAKGEATVHGFRSAFRDWAAEQTSIPGEVVEAALAHAIQNKVEAAYRRTQYLEKRRPLMQLWADYLDGRSADVIQLKPREATA